MNKYFKILQLSENASEEDIRKAYRKLAKEYHPDVNKSKDAHEKFIEISEAYEILLSQRNKRLAKEQPYETAASKAAEEAEYERFREEIRERASRQAQMRYEEFVRQNEAFQKSGLKDLGLLFTIFIRLLLLPLTAALIVVPFVVAFHTVWYAVFILLLTGPFAAILLWYMKDKRKGFFMPGNFYYNFKRIKRIFYETTACEKECFYCKGHIGNHKPFVLTLIKLKDIRLSTKGFRQHNANYVTENVQVLVPRSQKALIIHTLNIGIKVLSILLCLFLLPVDSLVWRFIFGIISGGTIAALVNLFTRTKSSVSYLYSFGFVIRVLVWLLPLIIISGFSFSPLNITTSDFIYLTVVCIVLFDCLLMQLLNAILGKQAYLPLVRQYEDVKNRFDEGYKVYNDIPIISVVFPLYKWIFG
ncbi:MAG TPA: DnaJ domain-containing protein [Bacteroidales bacterium]|nr:DnaJ domain-containing protein [Bacteroidales bacterium]